MRSKTAALGTFSDLPWLARSQASTPSCKGPGRWAWWKSSLPALPCGAGFCASRPRKPRASRRGPGEAPEHVVQDPAIAEIVELIEGVDRRAQRHRALLAARKDDVALEPLHRLDLAQADEAHGLVALEVKRLPRHAVGEDERQNAHADQVRAMDALE